MHRLLFIAFVFMGTDLAARLPDLIPYRNGNKWGYCDSTKKLVIDTVYESAGLFHSGKAVVGKYGQYGVINEAGATVLKCSYNLLFDVGFSGYWSGCVFGTKVGLIDSTGKFAVPPIYDAIYYSSPSYVVTKKDKVYFILKLDGTEVYRSQDIPVYIPETNTFIIRDTNQLLGVKDADLKSWIVKPKYAGDIYYSCGAYYGWNGETLPKRIKRHKWFGNKKCRKQTNELIYPVPNCTWTYRDSGKVFTQKGLWAFHYVTKDSIISMHWGWENNQTGAWLGIPKYDSTGYFSYGLALFREKDKVGMVNEKFEEVIPAKYERLLPVSDGLVMVTKTPRAQISFHLDLRLFMGYVDIHGTEYWED